MSIAGLLAATGFVIAGAAWLAVVGVVATGTAGGAAGVDSPRNFRMSRSVWMAPSCSGLTGGASGIFSCNADRISTRLMESIPRSASSDMSGFNISAG